LPFLVAKAKGRRAATTAVLNNMIAVVEWRLNPQRKAAANPNLYRIDRRFRVDDAEKKAILPPTITPSN
jgi:hypothetical protein